jgi:hypothetical protein
VVIDQDELAASLEFGMQLFDDLAPGQTLLGGNLAPWIRRVKLNLPTQDAIVQSLLTGGNTSPKHPAQAFLDRGSLNQSIQQGFYARPCLVPLVWRRIGDDINKELARACTDLEGKEEMRIVVTCSVLGGAGGGLLVPVLQRLRTVAPDAKISVVLFDEYFSFEGISEQERRRFRSNARGVLKMMLMQFQTPQSFGIVRCVVLRGDIQRTSSQERAGNQLPWPASEGRLNPFAEACYAVDKLFADTQFERPRTPTRLEFSYGEVSSWWHSLSDARERTLNGLEFLVAKNGIERLAHDPFAEQVWGKKIPELLTMGWKAWIQHGDDKDHDRFPSLVSAEVKKLYNSGNYSLKKLFPQFDPDPKLASLHKLASAVPEVNTVPKVSNIPRWCAVNLVYFLLRGGKA